MAVTPNYSWPVPVNTDLVKDGAVAIKDLGDAVDATLGTGLLAWTAYTPTLTGMTVGTGGTVTARFSKTGKVVNGYIRVVFGTGFTITDLDFSLPVAKQATTTYVQGVWTLVSTGAGDVPAINRYEGSNSVQAYAMNAAGTYVSPAAVSSTVPFVWKETDVIGVGFTYECV